MLPVGVQNENAARCPPHQCTLGSICGVFGLSFGCHFAPKGGAEGAFLNIWECRQSMFKTKNATCYHIFEHRAMLSVGVSKEEGQHYITFFKMRECSQQIFKRKNAARCPPINAPGSIFGAFCLSFGCHFEPKGGAEGGLGRPFGPLCVPCRPPVAPRSIFG